MIKIKIMACKCKPKDKSNWEIWQYKCNYSAFSGYNYTPSDYSLIMCKKCSSVWRTKADYVSTLKFKIK